MPPPLTRIREVFDAVVETARAGRAALLDSLTAGEAELRAEVLALLAVHDGNFLANATVLDETADEPFGGELPVEMDGYRLLEKLGEGGHGAVFLAEQLRPVQRRVAVKILKPGLDSSQILQRFGTERQTLALMDHPGIARVYDAGTTSEGRPYVVMELVDGLAITDWCRIHRPDHSTRLRLFADVCRAVQHAHGKGIIHRDLKPSNILVSASDSGPVPKVIDFGISRAVDPGSLPQTAGTDLRLMMGTPAYMSPEQTITEAPPDTRSDIYSLGVVLYELLTGVTPFDTATLHAAAAAEVRRLLREETPPKPSTRVANRTLTSAAIGQPTSPDLSSPERLLRGDLDWIVMKALEKEPARRYDTASAFAEDIRRHLAHEPVLAGPPSPAYRLAKFVRRHRTGVAATGIVLLALLTGLGVAAWGLVQARREAAARQIQAGRAKSLSTMLVRLFSTSDPVALQTEGYTVRTLLEDFDRELATADALEPQVELPLRQTFGRAWHSLGVWEKAGAQLERSLTLALGVYGPESPETASVRHDLGTLLADRGHYHESGIALEQALPHRTGSGQTLTRAILADVRRRLGDLPAALPLAAAVSAAEAPEIRALQLAAEVYAEAGNFPAAESAATRALDLARASDGSTGARAFHPLHTLARVRQLQGRTADGEALAAEALAIASQRLGPDHPLTLRARRQMDLFRVSSVAAQQQLTADYLNALGADHPESLQQLLTTVSGILASGNADAARDMLCQAFGVSRQDRDSGRFLRREQFAPACLRVMVSGREADFESVIRSAWETNRRTRGPADLLTLDLQRMLACIRLAVRDFPGCDELSRDILTQCESAFGHDHARSIEALLHLMYLQRDQQHTDEFVRMASDIHQRCLVSDGLPAVLGDDLYRTGTTLYKSGHYTAAAAAYADAAAFQHRAETWSVFIAGSNAHADCLRKLGDLPGALTIIESAQQALTDHFPPTAGLFVPVTLRHAEILSALHRQDEARSLLLAATHALRESPDAAPGQLKALQSAAAAK